MPVVMLVKCEKCGYENFPQHRYCGMCASPLRIPGVPATQPPPAPTGLPPVQHAAPKYEERPATPPKEAALRQVSGPSFLGLGQEPAEDKSFSYLFEDETPSHRGRNVILILLLAAAAAAAIWHWRQDLRVVTDRLLDTLPAAQKPAASNKTDATSPAPAPADSTAGAASSGSSSAPSEPTAAVPGTPTQAAQTPPPAAPDAAAGPPAGSGTTESTPAGSEAQTPNQPRAESAPSKASTHEESEKSDSDEAPSPPPHARKPAVTKAARAAPTASRADDLEAQGEKYLYGNGVPENCARARTNLMAAAEHSSAQAESVLGTMYATGHCATRDLPTAYRWFGRSLREDPKNTRIEQDLKVLWNQMTPGERQLAMRNEH